MASGGYEQLKKANKIHKKRDYKQDYEKGKKRMYEKLGEDIAGSLKEEYDQSTKGEQDGIIKTLLTENRSWPEIKGLLGVGGYKLNRIAQELTIPPEERLAPPKKVPKHALTDADKNRIKAAIDAYDLEPGYPCAHREPLIYLHDGKKEWQDVYNDYVATLEAGHRVVSKNRFREYVKFFYPRLRLKRHQTDVCNVCYKIDIELEQENITEDRKTELQVQKDVHIGKI